MSFIWPLMLLTLLALVPLVALYVRLQRRRRGLAARYGSLGLVRVAGRGVGRWRHLPAALFLIGLALLGVALARPRAVVNLPRIEGTVILAFDISASMSADDIKPSRMEVAKAAARDFVQRQPPTVQIGVVAFSESGLAVQPPTDDQQAILAAINRLSPGRGTSLANGINASLTAIALAQSGQRPRYYSNLTPAAAPTPTPVPQGTFTPAVIVLLTDGDNTTPPNPLVAAQAAADRGVRIHTIGLGSPTGATLKVEGFSVFSRLDEETLRQIAQRTDGTYHSATDAAALDAAYRDLGSRLVVRPQQTEITAIFSGAGLLALLIGGAFSLFWFGRVP